MIGVLSRPEQAGVVSEFFELFKTPWESYREGGAYDVVLSTVRELPDVHGRLILVFAADQTNVDERCGLVSSERPHARLLNYRGTPVPLYGSVRAFGSRSEVDGSPRTESVALESRLDDQPLIRAGYDLFDEVRFLLRDGQPLASAHVPTLDLHIAILREWILNAGIPFIEIPPTPPGHAHSACLTHDIDFVGIRPHGLDHTTLGFVYRATLGAARNFMRRRLSLKQLLQSWLSVASLPFVHLGWVRDFWQPFEWYLDVEKELPATYFLIPFKRQAGDKVPGPTRVAARRATAYDVNDISEWASVLRREGYELGVHGIDAWHSSDKGRIESERLSTVTGALSHGIRMHWLLQDEATASVLDRAGYIYDSTVGYNETIGYRAGTSQVFRPLGTGTLLELPLHIQDGALFYGQRLDLSESDAWQRCAVLLQNAKQFGGVLTLLWHDRSHAPERFWGGFYLRLIETLRESGVWFGSAGQVVDWFRQRREVRFERYEQGIRLRHDGGAIEPPLTVRHHESSSSFGDTAWSGTTDLDVSVSPGDHRTLAPVPIEQLSLS